MSTRALAVGLLTGVVLTLAHAVLPDRWAVLAGTSALWGVVPMLVSRRPGARGIDGAVWGILAMVGTLVPWLVVHADSTSAAELGLWLVVGPVAGAVCGTAGAASARDGGRGALAAGLVPGIVAGEAVYGLVLVGGPAWGLELAVALVLLAVVSRPARRAPALGSAVVALALVYFACLGYDALLS
ncbi:DUF6518 family protein [Dietzia maris]